MELRGRLTFAENNFSGSPLIYPPLGALANSLGGLAATRLLSLAFMLASTILLYLITSRLFSQSAAVFATALWAISEPTIRLAFATYDPLSILLTTLAVWFIVRAADSRGQPILVAAAAIALALANVTAYSGMVIDPVVIIFALLVWLPEMRLSRALLRTSCLAVGCIALLISFMTVSRSWTGLAFSVLNRSSFAHQGPLIVTNQIWEYSGLTIVLAVIGAAAAIATAGWPRSALVVWLACAAVVVPAAQIHAQTTESLDKHLAYGTWFAAMAAGYGLQILVRQLPATSRMLAAACCVIALSYPAAISWEQAWARFHGWANAHQLVASLAPIAKRATGPMYVPWHEAYVTEYYVPPGHDWRRWTSNLSLNPRFLSSSAWQSYYSTQLRTANYSTIVLFYPTTFSSAPGLPKQFLLSGSPTSQINGKLLALVGSSSGAPGLHALTQAIEGDHDYRLVADGPYDASRDHSIFAIWQKVQG